MPKKIFLLLCLLLVPFSRGGRGAAAQGNSSIHVDVVLVQLSVAITDRNGNYVRGLHHP